MVGYLGIKQFLPELLHELKCIKTTHGELVIADGPKQESIWAQNLWLNPEIIHFDSISQAAKALKSRGKLWSVYSFENHRRAQLIQDQLPKIKTRIIDFLAPLPEDNLGAWCLIDKNTIIASSKTDSPFPLGSVAFNEDKKTPPSRAYLKLWELFTVHGVRPKAGEHVVDFGSCPGGWTWVLHEIGCHVVSIDRAPLDPKIANLPRVEFINTNAFTVKPDDVGQIDWFFSDIICYPEKLFELVQLWNRSGYCKNFVCTLKFQGETNFQVLDCFKSLENVKIKHLHHNKHEVTVWMTKS
jgi:23S rRNA (cytidine2498-2'-O)-methyltransferase